MTAMKTAGDEDCGLAGTVILGGSETRPMKTAGMR